jgi:hypothetical protein
MEIKLDKTGAEALQELKYKIIKEEFAYNKPCIKKSHLGKKKMVF